MEPLFDAADAGAREGLLLQNITIDKGRGRIETRRFVVTNELSVMVKHLREWKGLSSVNGAIHPRSHQWQD